MLKRFLLACSLVTLLSPIAGVAGTQSDVTLAAAPSKVEIGAQYNGLQMKITGTVPSGSDVILRFTGAKGDLHLWEKGKVFGLLWMNVGKTTIANVPKVYIISTSRPFAELGPAAAQFSMQGLISSVEVKEQATTKEIDIEKELLLLKTKEGLFSESEQGVRLGEDKAGSRTFAAELAIPASLAPGSYNVEAVAVKDGEIVGTTETIVTSNLIGFPAWLSKLAFEKSLLYGIMATVIALVSGLAIGLVFQSKGAH